MEKYDQNNKMARTLKGGARVMRSIHSSDELITMRVS